MRAQARRRGGSRLGMVMCKGRDARHAELAALADALLQTERQAEVMDAVIRPLKAEEAAKRLAARRKAGATKVDFFTMVRAEG